MGEGQIYPLQGVISKPDPPGSVFYFFNQVPIEEIKERMEARYSQTITDADIKAFAGISEDRNLVHLDEEYVENSRYKKRIAHGIISSLFFSALFGTKIPVEGCVYVAQSLQIKRPVYLGGTVTAIITVIKTDLNKRRVFFRTTCKVKNKVVIDGEAEFYVQKINMITIELLVYLLGNKI